LGSFKQGRRPQKITRLSWIVTPLKVEGAANMPMGSLPQEPRVIANAESSAGLTLRHDLQIGLAKFETHSPRLKVRGIDRDRAFCRREHGRPWRDAREQFRKILNHDWRLSWTSDVVVSLVAGYLVAG